MKSLAPFLGGVFTGLAGAAAAYMYQTTHHVQWVANAPISLIVGQGKESVTFPAGTAFYHDSFFSEGLDQLVLYVNANTRERFDVKNSEMITPYWVAQ